jgi:hypothetical protein
LTVKPQTPAANPNYSVNDDKIEPLSGALLKRKRKVSQINKAKKKKPKKALNNLINNTNEPAKAENEED